MKLVYTMPYHHSSFQLIVEHISLYKVMHVLNIFVSLKGVNINPFTHYT